MPLFLILRGIRKRSANKIFLTRTTVTLGKKGSQAVNLASERLHEGIHAESGDLVCTPTKKSIEDKLKKTLKLQSPKKRRQPRSEDFQPKCLFCGKEEKDQKMGAKRSFEVRQLKTVEQQSFKRQCYEYVLAEGTCLGKNWTFARLCCPGCSFPSDCQIPKMFREEDPARFKKIKNFFIVFWEA